MFRRTKRASTAGSIAWVVVPAAPLCCRTRWLRTDQRSSAGLPSRAFTSATRLSLADAVHQGRRRQAAPRQPVASDLHLHAVPEEDHRGHQREDVHPQPAFGKEDAAQFDLRDRPRLPRARRNREVTDGHVTRLQSGTRRARPRSRRRARRCRSGDPSRAIRPSARASFSRSRVITSRPFRSSISLISVMWSSPNSRAATAEACSQRTR